MPQESMVNPSEMTSMPIADLFIPAWNPRPFIDPAELAELVAYIEKGGRVPRIVLWKGTGVAPYAVISGQRRLTAYEKLEKTHIDVEVLDITLEEARFLAIASNRDDKPFWLGEFTAIESLMRDNPSLKQVDIIDHLGWPKKRVSYAVNLLKLLNASTRQLIYASSQPKVPVRNFLEGQSPETPSQKSDWRLVEDVAIRLIPLLDNPSLEAAQTQAEQAVKLMIERQMTGTQTADLVAWAQAGKDIAQFEPAVKARKPRAASAPAEHTPAPQTDSHSSKPSTSTPAAKLEAVQPEHGSRPETSPQASPSATIGSAETIMWEALAGMSLVARIKAKIKKGERPSLFEGIVLVADLLWRGFAWVAKHGWKVAKLLLKETWKALKATLRALGAKVLRIVGGVLGFLFLCFIGWFGWDAYTHGILHPFQELGTLWAITHSNPATLKPVVHVPIVKPMAQIPVAQTAPEKETAAPVAKSPAKSNADASDDLATTVQKQSQLPQPTAVVTPQQVKKGDVISDVAGTLTKKPVTDAAGNVAKLFGL